MSFATEMSSAGASTCGSRALTALPISPLFAISCARRCRFSTVSAVGERREFFADESASSRSFFQSPVANLASLKAQIFWVTLPPPRLGFCSVIIGRALSNHVPVCRSVICISKVIEAAVEKAVWSECGIFLATFYRCAVSIFAMVPASARVRKYAWLAPMPHPPALRWAAFARTKMASSTGGVTSVWRTRGGDGGGGGS